MDNLFYYTGIIFLVEAVRCAFSAKKEVDSYKAGTVLPNTKNISVNDLDALKSTLMDSLKGKILPAIIGALMITWNIIGILYTHEYKLFIAGISSIVISSVVTGYNKKFRTVPIIIASNIILIIIISSILYSHFV